MTSAPPQAPAPAGPAQPLVAADPESTGSARYAVFAFLWAAAICIHLWNQPEVNLAEPWRWFTLAAAIAVLWRPRSTTRLAVLAVVHVVQVVAELPIVADHWLLAAFVHLIVLVSWVRVRRTRGTVTPAALLSDFAPAARLVLLICYSASVVAKYNYAFFDPATSCADFLLRTAAPWWSGVSPSPIAGIVLVGALATETSVPILLAFARTRRLGVLVGVVFHLVLGYTPTVAVFDFSALLFALFFLFTPLDATGKLAHEWRRITARRSPLARLAMSRWARAAVLLMATAASRWSLRPAEEALQARFRILLFAAYGGMVLVMAIAVLGRRQQAPPLVRPFAVRSPGLVAVLGLALATVLCQYTGLRTQGTFTMFSNIRTEGGTSNHLFLPRFSLFGYQDDLVTIVSSSEPRLQRLADDGQVLPFFELRRGLAARPDIAVTYVRANHKVTLARASDDPALVAPLPLLERKLLTFRATSGTGPSMCTN